MQRRRGPWGWVVRLVSRRISVKILAPYLAVTLILAVLATYISIQQMGSSLYDRLINQLLDAGRKVNDAMVTLEDNYLAAYRSMAFTQGVDKAIAAGNVEELQQMLQPIQINQRVPYVEIIDVNHKVLLSSVSPAPGRAERTEPDPETGDWDIVAKVLGKEQDTLGDKWAAIVPTNRGYVFYLAGPVRNQDGSLAGALLVGTPLQTLVADLTKQALAVVSLYTQEGRLLSTTLPYNRLSEGVPVNRSQAGDLMQSRELVYGRRLTVGATEYEELLGRLEVRKVPVFVMGVAYPSDFIVKTGSDSRNQQLALFSGVLIIVLVIGLTLANRITRPLRTLVTASRSVAAGDLSTEVPPTTEDETGELTATFNEMVSGLRERERVRDTFGKYMTREVSEYLTSNDIKLGGETRNVTMLMSDIRSFTSISEQMTPEDVVSMLNQYFAGQVGAILKYRGRVDKYMGDAILAVFGAPIPYDDHALRAVLSALEMRAALADFNQIWVAQGRRPLRFGIGVNTGEVVVGNIGTEQRMEYTIIGDAVNTTQRVEDLTKDFATDILITETTYAAVSEWIEVSEPHMVTLRGRLAEMAIYSVIGLRPGVTPTLSATQSPDAAPAAPAVQAEPVAAARG